MHARPANPGGEKYAWMFSWSDKKKCWHCDVCDKDTYNDDHLTSVTHVKRKDDYSWCEWIVEKRAKEPAQARADPRQVPGADPWTTCGRGSASASHVPQPANLQVPPGGFPVPPAPREPPPGLRPTPQAQPAPQVQPQGCPAPAAQASTASASQWLNPGLGPGQDLTNIWVEIAKLVRDQAQLKDELTQVRASVRDQMSAQDLPRMSTDITRLVTVQMEHRDELNQLWYLGNSHTELRDELNELRALVKELKERGDQDRDSTGSPAAAADADSVAGSSTGSFLNVSAP